MLPLAVIMGGIRIPGDWAGEVVGVDVVKIGKELAALLVILMYVLYCDSRHNERIWM